MSEPDDKSAAEAGRTIWLPGDDDPPPPAKVVCPTCLRQTYEGEHSPEECRVYQRKLERLRSEGGHDGAWLPEGWNG